VNQNSIIAAGSVVTRDVPPETVVKGVPARPMMTKPEHETKRVGFIKTRKI
jgi:acetyltransferase-like isoleucine patch superfamily enzyme